MTDMKPFSTYPEDRQKLLKLSDAVLNTSFSALERNAVELADLVKAILEDEAVAIADDEAFEAELDAADLMKIDDAWHNFKEAGPVARVINDNQPGNTAIIEILRSPPTLGVGTELFAAEETP